MLEILKNQVKKVLEKYNLNLKDIVLIFAVIFLESLHNVFYKRWTSQMSNYIWFIGSIISSLMFSVLIWSIILILFLINKIPKHKLKLDKKSNQFFFRAAILDTTASLLQSYASPYLSIGIQTILKQFCLVVTILLSKKMLRKKYFKTHYLSAVLIVYAILVALIPDFHASVNLKFNPIWIVVFIVNAFPSALSNVYKEKRLKEEISSTWANGWIINYQIILGLLTFPIIFLPLPYPAKTIKFSDFGDYLSDSFMCLGGYNMRPDDNCEGALTFLVIQTIFCVAFNIVFLKLIRKRGATLYMIIAAFRIPITAILGTSTFLQGAGYETTLNPELLLSLFMIILGVLVYNWIPEETMVEEQSQERYSMVYVEEEETNEDDYYQKYIL